MLEVTRFLRNKLSGRPLQDGLWLLLANLSLAAVFVLLMLSMFAGGIAPVLKPWMVILGMAAASIVVWCHFGRCLPPGQRLWRIGATTLTGMSPIATPTIYLYLKELATGCHGAEIMMMALGTGASAVATLTVFIGSRLPVPAPDPLEPSFDKDD